MIKLSDFVNLKNGSEVFDYYGKLWTVVLANCGRPTRHSTHLFKSHIGSQQYNQYYIFHDGKHMRFQEGGRICGVFEK